jgi:hypothetical protein
VKIYISATYRDLQKHRLAVLANLRRMGHQPIGMEDYAAEGVRPLSRCLDDVAKCDIYVGIIAWRYGSLTPNDAGEPSPPLPEETTLGITSITEMEFRRAVQLREQRKQQGQLDKPDVLMFLLDPEAVWPSTQIDAVSGDGEQGKAVSRLRQEVGQQYLVNFFRTPEELASLVSAAVYRVEMNRQMDVESLKIDAQLNEPFIRSGGQLADTRLDTIIEGIAGPQEVQALQVNIGQGHDWWMTRLYFLSSLAADLLSIEAMVFVDEGKTFIGMANPLIVKERLAQLNNPPIKKYEEALARSGTTSADLQSEVRRRAALWEDQMKEVEGEHSIATFVTKRGLERWLNPYLITQAIDWEPGENAALQMQRLVDWPMRFVPVVEKGRFDRVVDKNALTEQVARLFVREQVSRALSTIR